MDSLLVAHVAEAITALTGNEDYDAVSARAARLLKRSDVVLATARRYAGGSATAAELRDVVKHRM